MYIKRSLEKVIEINRYKLPLSESEAFILPQTIAAQNWLWINFMISSFWRLEVRPLNKRINYERTAKEDEYGIISRTMMNIRSLRCLPVRLILSSCSKCRKSSTFYWRTSWRCWTWSGWTSRAWRKRQELLQLIAGEGFSPEELLVCPKKHQNHVKKRYQKRHPVSIWRKWWNEILVWSWTCAKPIDEALKAGRSLEDFRINKVWTE